jgi:hypothetical protein
MGPRSHDELPATELDRSSRAMSRARGGDEPGELSRELHHSRCRSDADAEVDRSKQCPQNRSQPDETDCGLHPSAGAAWGRPSAGRRRPVPR